MNIIDVSLADFPVEATFIGLCRPADLVGELYEEQ